MRARRGFRVVLHAEGRHQAVRKTFDRVVVQIHMGDVDFIEVQTFGIDGKAVILGRDFNLLPLDAQNGMVPAVMAEF